MARFLVEWREVHSAWVEVDAESEEEAIQVVEDGLYDESTYGTDFSHIYESQHNENDYDVKLVGQ